MTTDHALRPHPHRPLGLVLTGGTLGSRREHSGGVRLEHAGKLPELDLVASAFADRRGLDLSVRQPFRASSEEMTPAHWLVLASSIRELVREGAGAVLVLHGTDTASYSAAALAFLLADVRAPVVLTGANLPPDHPESDAATNISDALVALDDLSPGVYVSFAGVVHLGTHVRKVSASGATFASVHRRPVGQVGDGVFVAEHLFDEAARPPLVPHLDTGVLAVTCHPGIDFHAVAAMMHATQRRGLVVELYPTATAPTTDGALAALVETVSAAGGVTVGVVPAADGAGTALYESTMRLADAGMLLLPSLLREVAIVKLMLALGSSTDVVAVERAMRREVAGEFSSPPHMLFASPVSHLADYRRD